MMSGILTIQGLLVAEPDLLKNNLYPWIPEEMRNGYPYEDFEVFVLHNVWELEVLYPEPESFGKAVNAWGKVQAPVWEAIRSRKLEAVNIVGGKETRDRKFETARNNEGSGNGSSSTSGSDTTETDISAFNTTGYVPKDKQTVTYGGKVTNNNSSKATMGGNDTEHEEINRGTEEAFDTEMKKMKMIIDMNVMEMIVTMFKEEFFLMVY